MEEEPQVEEMAPDVCTNNAGTKVILIVAAAPSRWAGQVSGTVHASYDGKRPLCQDKDLKNAMVVTGVGGFTRCAHPSGKCSTVLESLGVR